MTDPDTDPVDPTEEPDSGPADGGSTLESTGTGDNAEAVLDAEAGDEDEAGESAAGHAERVERHGHDRGVGAEPQVDAGRQSQG